MKLAIVSDVHGNLIAFDAVIAAVQEESPDLVVHSDDLVLNGPHPAEAVDRVRELGWPGIVGNTDEVLWGGMAKVPKACAPAVQRHDGFYRRAPWPRAVAVAAPLATG